MSVSIIITGSALTFPVRESQFELYALPAYATVLNFKIITFTQSTLINHLVENYG